MFLDTIYCVVKYRDMIKLLKYCPALDTMLITRDWKLCLWTQYKVTLTLLIGMRICLTASELGYLDTKGYEEPR